jgi:hypothetical protein
MVCGFWSLSKLFLETRNCRPRPTSRVLLPGGLPFQPRSLRHSYLSSLGRTPVALQNIVRAQPLALGQCGTYRPYNYCRGERAFQSKEK